MDLISAKQHHGHAHTTQTECAGSIHQAWQLEEAHAPRKPRPQQTPPPADISEARPQAQSAGSAEPRRAGPAPVPPRVSRPAGHPRLRESSMVQRMWAEAAGPVGGAEPLFPGSRRSRSVWDAVRLEVGVPDSCPVVLHSFTQLDPDLPRLEVGEPRPNVLCSIVGGWIGEGWFLPQKSPCCTSPEATSWALQLPAHPQQ